MDKKTIDQYNSHYQEYADDWLDQKPPQDMYDLLKKYFALGKTIDIGCGAGRDTYWLSKNGFSDVTGVDASDGLLSVAKEKYPNVEFLQSALPELSNLEGDYKNILCETVVMHLPEKDIIKSVKKMKSLLVKSGVLYLSWRRGDSECARSEDNRLYTFFDNKIILDQFEKSNILEFSENTSVSSNRRVSRLIYRR